MVVSWRCPVGMRRALGSWDDGGGEPTRAKTSWEEAREHSGGAITGWWQHLTQRWRNFLVQSQRDNKRRWSKGRRRTINLKKVSLETVAQEELSLWENACGEYSKQQPLLANTATTWSHTFKTASWTWLWLGPLWFNSPPPPLPPSCLSWVRDYVCVWRGN